MEVKSDAYRKYDHKAAGNAYDDDGKGVEITTTNSSRVEISTFLPDGTFKCLA